MPQDLEGRRILITRSARQSSRFQELLERLGAEVVSVPTIEFRARPNLEIDPVAAHPGVFAWVVFTSANGVRFFLERCQKLNTLSVLRSDSGPRICAVGPATSACVESFGLEVDLIPTSFRAEGVVEAFRRMSHGQKGVKILLPIASLARDTLAEGLRELGAELRVLPVYDTVPPSDAGDWLRASLRDREPDLITFMSSSTARNFVAICHPDIDSKRFHYGVIGPAAGDTCRELGIAPVIESQDSTVTGLVQAIREYFLNQDDGHLEP